jgi:hypothetical protein
MAVGAQDTEVGQPVVGVVTVDMVERQREVLAAPPLKAALLASRFLQACLDQSPT